MPPEQASDKETRIANALQDLTPKELGAYKYFRSNNQPPLSEAKSDELFRLYMQGHSCEEICKIGKNMIGLGQIVACRLMYGWDARKVAHRANLEANVPARAAVTHLETVDFLADILTISQVAFKEKMQEYLATGNKELLKDLPLPKSTRELQSLFELFMKATGQEKKRIEVTGGVTVTHANGVAMPVSSEEAAEIMDRLLPDAEIIPVEPSKS